MSLTLSQMTAAVGGALAGLGAWGLIAPAGFRAGVLAFPRNRFCGSLLAVLALTWSAYALQDLSLGGLEQWKVRAFYLIPVAAFLIIVYLDELLAARALGGILLLLPTPWLAQARWSQSDWSYVPRVMAYVFVVVGMYWVATPYRFRRWLQPVVEHPSRLRVFAACLAALGALQIVLAAVVF